MDMNNRTDLKKERVAMLKPHLILRYLASDDDKVDTLIMCNPDNYLLRAYDKDVYEALACLHDDEFSGMSKLRKFFEVVDIVSYRGSAGAMKPVMTEGRMQQIRNFALKKK